MTINSLNTVQDFFAPDHRMVSIYLSSKFLDNNKRKNAFIQVFSQFLFGLNKACFPFPIYTHYQHSCATLADPQDHLYVGHYSLRTCSSHHLPNILSRVTNKADQSKPIVPLPVHVPRSFSQMYKILWLFGTCYQKISRKIPSKNQKLTDK